MAHWPLWRRRHGIDSGWGVFLVAGGGWRHIKKRQKYGGGASFDQVLIAAASVNAPSYWRHRAGVLEVSKAAGARIAGSGYSIVTA
jgi:hypothetical protein